MLQPQPNPRDEELLEGGMIVIWNALREGKINIREFMRLSAEWKQRVRDTDEDVEGCYSSDTLDS